MLHMDLCCGATTILPIINVQWALQQIQIYPAMSYTSPQREFNNPAVVGYMESHDEERTMYKNITFGNSSGSYNVRNLNTALAREEAAATVFFTVPGPKMIWQFGERGYDIPLTFRRIKCSKQTTTLGVYDWYLKEYIYIILTRAIIQLRLSNPAVFNNTSFHI